MKLSLKIGLSNSTKTKRIYNALIPFILMLPSLGSSAQQARVRYPDAKIEQSVCPTGNRSQPGSGIQENGTRLQGVPVPFTRPVH